MAVAEETEAAGATEVPRGPFAFVLLRALNFSSQLLKSLQNPVGPETAAKAAAKEAVARAAGADRRVATQTKTTTNTAEAAVGAEAAAIAEARALAALRAEMASPRTMNFFSRTVKAFKAYTKLKQLVSITIRNTKTE
jgi:hypothetical protein